MISAVVVGVGVALHNRVRSLVRGVVALLLAGCFYIDPINTAPPPMIQVPPPGPYHFNDTSSTTTSTAVAVDPDGDAMTFEWHCTECVPNVGTSPMYRVTFATHGSVQVRLIV